MLYIYIRFMSYFDYLSYSAFIFHMSVVLHFKSNVCVYAFLYAWNKISLELFCVFNWIASLSVHCCFVYCVFL
jgi:hypothetical protein